MRSLLLLGLLSTVLADPVTFFSEKFESGKEF